MCPKCGAPRLEAALECPRCGVIYAKASSATPLRKKSTQADRTPVLSQSHSGVMHRSEAFDPPAFVPLEPALWEGRGEDEQTERWVRRLAIPLALGMFWILTASDTFRYMFVRIFMSMWIHEAGHAVSAWASGFLAFPGPWLTPVSDSRALSITFVVLTALAAGIALSVKNERWGWVTGYSALILLVVMLTFGLKEQDAKALFIFGGDGGCFVLGTALMLTVYAPEGSRIRTGWLRWGFLTIGAAAFCDAGRTWYAARTDVDAIPFGANEGVGTSDPTRLVDDFNWGTHELVQRYNTLAVVCLVVLAAVWLYGLTPSRQRTDN